MMAKAFRTILLVSGVLFLAVSVNDGTLSGHAITAGALGFLFLGAYVSTSKP
jgi:hypothetical protein